MEKMDSESKIPVAKRTFRILMQGCVTKLHNNFISMHCMNITRLGGELGHAVEILPGLLKLYCVVCS